MRILNSKRIWSVIIVITAVAAVAGSPLRVSLNKVEAVIRTTLISQSGKTLVAANNKNYPGSGWQRNLSGSGSTPLTKAACQAATGPTNGWAWFADADGNGLTTDPEDGLCVATTTTSATNWNGAVLVNAFTLADTAATGGDASSVTASGASWVVDRYKNEIVKINSGAAAGAWGMVKSNSATVITVYGSWLEGAYNPYATASTSPDGTSHFQVFDDWKYDNSWIGDYSCTGNFPDGTVTHNLYPASGSVALEISDCKDGKRDLLPNENDRAVVWGSATGVAGLQLTDVSQSMTVNLWIGQKLLITAGTGVGSYGIIESNTSDTVTVGSWSGTPPAAGSAWIIVYIVPHGSYVSSSAKIFWTADDARANKGPLDHSVLIDWKGTRLPTVADFYGYCGAKSGSSFGTAGNSYYYSSAAASSTALGNYGGNAGRGRNPSPYNNFINLSNTSYEWLSEQGYYNTARGAGNVACSYVVYNGVNSSVRFRAVFRP